MTLDQVIQAAKIARDLKGAEEAMAALTNIKSQSGRLVFETNAVGGNARFETQLSTDQVQRSLKRFIDDAKLQLANLGVTV